MVSRLTDKIRFLGETVFEFDESQEAVVDLERLQIGYRWSDALHLTAGRGHTALGYWNEAYHHGKLLQPTVERPEVLKFEDDGGILPIHFVGLEAGGRAAFGAWDLAYVAYVANGRGIQNNVRHEGQGTAEDYSHEGAYAVGVLHFGGWSPYVGIDWLDLDSRDPFYPPPYTSVTRTLLGLRWDLASFNCLKLEYQRADRSWGVENTVVLQSAFTF